MMRKRNKELRSMSLTAVVCAWFVLFFPHAVLAEEKVPELDEAASKIVESIENDFDESLKDLGELAGEVFSCVDADDKRSSHEDRVREIYGDLNKLFGTDRAFLFAAAFGYGAASELDEKTCTELTDEFRDRFGAISEKYDLVD